MFTMIAMILMGLIILVLIIICLILDIICNVFILISKLFTNKYKYVSFTNEIIFKEQ
jgi:hypothetical protein